MTRDFNVARLRLLYPETIPFDDLCSLLHFSKRKVKWMLDMDWIKHETFERKTWRYNIPTESVIDYLLLSEKRPDLFIFPTNCFSSRKPPNRGDAQRIIFYEPEEITATLRILWRRVPDIISLKQVVDLTGYSKERVQRIMALHDVNVLTVKQSVFFNKEAAIEALSYPSSQRQCDYSEKMQTIMFKYPLLSEAAANE